MPTRIYLVEDNATVAKLLAPLLQALTSAEIVGSSASEFEACTWLQAHPALWDLLVLDLGLAKGTGFGVLQCLNNRSAMQKIVVFTNCPAKVARARCLRAGANAFFAKLSQTEQLVDYINVCNQPTLLLPTSFFVALKS